MALVLTEEERMLQDSARAFVSANAPVSALRKLRDTQTATGYEPGLWQQMAEMGWAGLLIPEDAGGLGFSHVGAGVIAEECGKTLAASPLFASGVMAAAVIREAGSAEQKAALLPSIADGSRILTVAIDERSRHAPLALTTGAARDGDKWVLNTCKTMVLDGHVADAIIVVARSSGVAGDANGISLFLVDREQQGVTVQPNSMVDSRNASDLSLDNVVVGPDALIGTADDCWPALERALDVSRVVLAAEMLGVAGEAFARTIEYLKQRKQFDVLIGGFQALQHRAAELFSDIEMSRSVVLKALRALDDSDADVRAIASVAKAHACKTVTRAANEAVQMHGGIGMTDEYDIGFYMKRAVALRHLLGDAYFHADRYAMISGY